MCDCYLSALRCISLSLQRRTKLKEKEGETNKNYKPPTTINSFCRPQQPNIHSNRWYKSWLLLFFLLRANGEDHEERRRLMHKTNKDIIEMIHIMLFWQLLLWSPISDEPDHPRTSLIDKWGCVWEKESESERTWLQPRCFVSLLFIGMRIGSTLTANVRVNRLYVCVLSLRSTDNNRREEWRRA